MQKSRYLFTIILLSIFLPALVIASPAYGANTLFQETDTVDIYFFWGEGCPYCKIAEPVLEDIAYQNPRVNFYEFEIYNNAQNRELFFEFCEAYGIDPRAVPTTFVGSRQWVGYTDSVGREISQTVNECLAADCPSPGREIIARWDGISPAKERARLNLPVIGEVDLVRTLLAVGGILVLGGLIFLFDRVMNRKK